MNGKWKEWAVKDWKNHRCVLYLLDGIQMVGGKVKSPVSLDDGQDNNLALAGRRNRE